MSSAKFFCSIVDPTFYMACCSRDRMVSNKGKYMGKRMKNKSANGTKFFMRVPP